ncbi:caffeine-induced death protein 2 [Pseudomassariella vexata]|uniref:Caffeine-induced death protein 2 n=1 Tax=Pseudomassariella vexata TaxID=1141098 RepID=A0A1Y2DDW9_9PEZI|nr:caffeine-induced death protein 2 [Pseudomassariella vexata]ORY57439.1 caffeine-induced death protein 2 [Pseudomassariella vexata]
MTDIPTQPGLTPQFCFSTVALRDFLRLSRAAVDDSITQNLNALVTPAKTGFDPHSTSTRVPRDPQRSIDPRVCQGFKDQVLFPSWQSRSDILAYCAYVATSPDPNDPETTLREAESLRYRERVVNERLDPYSARYFPREPRTQQLATLLRQERGVETIVRSQTWGVIRERCGDATEDSDQALSQWRDRQRKPSP